MYPHTKSCLWSSKLSLWESLVLSLACKSAVPMTLLNVPNNIFIRVFISSSRMISMISVANTLHFTINWLSTVSRVSRYFARLNCEYCFYGNYVDSKTRLVEFIIEALYIINILCFKCQKIFIFYYFRLY